MVEKKTSPYIRSVNGLLDNVEYIFNENGGIDWRKMVKPEFLVFNLQYQEKIEEVYGKSVSELSVSEVDDKYLLILLGGIKELARLRGFEDVHYTVSPISDIFVAATCHITWIGNFETESRRISFGDAADATNSNTTGFGKSYLTAVAVNRAFVRAVKNFLGINILGKDEIPERIISNQDSIPEETESSSPHVMLQRALDKAKLTFEKVKNKCIKDGNVNAEKWECIYDIEKSTVFDLLGKIQKKYGTI